MTLERNLKLYFPNLNGLRFIAACFVIINHVEQLKLFYKISDRVSDFAKIIGKLGVMLFFVLSGFLITYILLFEEKSSGKIHVKKFYSRRFLRIAPLYFLLILLVFFIIQNFSFMNIPLMKNPLKDNFNSILALYIVFLPNLATAIFGFIPYIAQAWSIGAEQQSYILWPLLLKITRKNRVFLMIGIIFFYLLIRLVLSNKFPLEIPNQEIIRKFWRLFNIDSISIGGIFAIFLFKKHPLLKYIVNNITFCITGLITIILLLLAIKIPFFHYLGYSILFGIIIINLAANKSLKSILEWSIIDYLGRISYGIYMYHFLVMIFVLKLVTEFEIRTNWIIYPLTILGTIAVSSISYHFFEVYFLKRKAKYTFIKSGGNKF